MIQPDAAIAITMTADRWNQVLAVMSEAPLPHRVTDPLIREIHAQCVKEDPDNVTRLHEVES